MGKTSSSKGQRKCATCEFFTGADRAIKSNGWAEYEMNGYGSCTVDGRGKEKRQQANHLCSKYQVWRMMK